ncbi:MAG: NAD-glutamate dehydrogenase, partial [Gammaproteobacteria bacterium]|nr:NAD-glutamate dehydrogenase [Gammaproteobacteria bacterium]
MTQAEPSTLPRATTSAKDSAQRYDVTIAAIRAEVAERAEASEDALAFADTYLSQISIDTVLESSIQALSAVITRQWESVVTLQHQTGNRQRAIGAFNPLAFRGAPAQHSVLELLCPDQPFIVDTLRILFANEGIRIHRLLHPVVPAAVVPKHRAKEQPAPHLAVMHIEIDRQSEATLQRLEKGVAKALEELSLVTADTDAMRVRARDTASQIRDTGTTEAETADFLHWLLYDSFVFLEAETLSLSDAAHDTTSHRLGLCKLEHRGCSLRGRDEQQQILDAALVAPNGLVVTKLTVRSPIHRATFLDYIVAIVDRDHESCRAVAFVGLFSGSAYHQSASSIPLLRSKLQRILKASGYPPEAHAARSINAILQSFPRHLLFQASERELLVTSQTVLDLEIHSRTRLLVYPDPFGRFLACVVYLPRDGFNTDVRLAIQAQLESGLRAEVSEFTVELGAASLVRLSFTLLADAASTANCSLSVLEESLNRIVRGWADVFEECTLQVYGEEHGARLCNRYRHVFRADYREHYTPEVASVELTHFEHAHANGIAIALGRPTHAPNGAMSWRLKLFLRDAPACLSEALPVLEHLGLVVEDERQTAIELADQVAIYVHDFGVRTKSANLELDATFTSRFEQTFLAAWLGDMESDGFNRLVLVTTLSPSELTLLRAYFRYFRQTGTPFSQRYIEDALYENPLISQRLVDLFNAKFSPQMDHGAPAQDERGARVDECAAQIKAELEKVASLDQDRILRGLLHLVIATVRTNYFSSHEQTGHLALKFDPSQILELPQPVPKHEIFVYASEFEGVHLRGGEIARGGIRWSDRIEDFRTEVLGLMKAQMVKNAVIVPVGSKGGFVVKRATVTPDDARKCYRKFIGAMLSITDNVVNGAVVRTKDLIAYDGDDPYLVVAADKGTATFSDDANDVAMSLGFWLGDAFASGGSTGYDHKAMGITARGGWESVKRHFREFGTNTQEQDTTVVGIGDMGGDVFGNAMLLSPHIRLVAAFNHRHIFIDPTPDPASSMRERERLFAAPAKAGWDHYDTNLLSDGGGIFSRSAKSITLSEAAQRALDISQSTLSPSELIRAILRAPVDLLWNGGIGTYVKAQSESDTDVGDRTNDEVRIDGASLRAKVVGEGGNLGFTQLGRIEYALAGGRIYTDAVDNAAGVNCSDHEVNIKILLSAVLPNSVEPGDDGLEARNALLQTMTDAVGEHVLADNYLQTQALSLADSESEAMHDVHCRLLDFLEREAELNRKVEGLPEGDKARERSSFTLPELAVLLAYTKNWLTAQLVDAHEPI